MVEGTRQRRARGSAAAKGPKSVALLALLGLWVLFPFLQVGALAEDAIPFLAATRVQDATGIYTDDETKVPPPLRDAGCTIAPPGTDCAQYILPFFSPPQVLPVIAVVDLAGDTGGVLVLRLLGVLSFAGGTWLLWTRTTRRCPEAETPLLLTAVLLTPFVYTSATFGQSSPLLFLSACLGLRATDRHPGAVGAALVWVGTVAFKLFPLPLLAVAVLRRRWRFVAWSSGLLVLLTVLAVPLAPDGSYGEFLSSTRALTANRVASPFNVSIDAFIHLFDRSWRGDGAAFLAVEVLRVAGIAGLCWWKLRDADEDLQWAYAWMVLLALHPQVWWHYFPLIVPATALALIGRRGHWWYVLPAVALAILPMALVTSERTLTYVGPVLIVAATIGVPLLVRPGPVATRPATGNALDLAGA